MVGARRGFVLLLLLCATTVLAKPKDRDVIEARKQFKRGLAHYNLEEYKEAVDAFQDAYRLHPDPAILFNLAQAHRLANNHERALYFYRVYLRSSPNAPNQAEVKGRIADLERLMNDQKQLTKPPDAVVPPKETTVESAPPSVVQKSAAVEKAPAAVAPAPKPTPVYKKWWLWTIVGLVVVGGAVGAGVALGTRSSAPNSYPGLSF
jgi:tetratricopeptide (TPR) repeat protein